MLLLTKHDRELVREMVRLPRWVWRILETEGKKNSVKRTQQLRMAATEWATPIEIDRLAAAALKKKTKQEAKT